MLFIDEAYSLSRDADRLDFGDEAIETLLEADGGPPPPARRDRRRLSAADAPVPRVEPGPALAVLPRDRVPRLLDGRSSWRSSAASPPRTQYTLGEGAEDALRAIFENAERDESFGNARFARTLFEQALNAQALRLGEGEVECSDATS